MLRNFTMDLDEISLTKTLHYLIERFISSIKNCFNPEVLGVKKVFQEIVKRSEGITQDLRMIAISALTSLETSDVLDIKDQLNKKIEDLIQKLLQQDFVELLNGNEEHLMISESDLHMFLLTGAMTDITDFTPSSLKLDQSLGFHFLLPTTIGASGSICEPSQNINFNCLLSSSQFENTRMQFEDEVSELRRISAHGFSASDLNMFNVATILKYENDDMKKPDSELLDNSSISGDYVESSTSCVEFDLAVLEEIDSQDFNSFHSWEGCLGKFLPHHFYVSEVTPEAALLSISEKEPHIFYSLLNPSAALSEKDMAYDVLDMLIGIPSNTFFYDIHARKFRLRSGVHLLNLSPECTAKVVSKFIESGSIYYLLQIFSQDFVSAGEGLVFKGFQLGLQQVLTIYKELIAAVKVSSPSMLFLRTDVLQNAEMMQTFGAVCGIDTAKMIFNEIPKGLGLLSYLHDVARCHKRKETGIMIAVLLKYTYAPYFSFLNKWMTEGICDDPYGEFQIMEDFNYFQRRDVMYWNFAYTENIDDPTRAVPSEIKNYSQGILDCGKSIALLKICCPDIFSLKYLFYQPPPALSMLYSFSAAICKFEECEEYISLKEKAEEMYQIKSTQLSLDTFYTKCQKFVNRESMMNLVQRRWNIIYAAKIANYNILSFSQVKQNLNDHDLSMHIDTNLKNSNKKWNSLHDVSTESYEYNFDGQLCGNIGLIFSSCGYFKTNLKYDNEECHFSPTNFSKQLDLISYTQDFAVNSLKLMRSKYKEMFSISEMEFLNSFQIGDFSTNRSLKMKDTENNFSVKCDNFRKFSSNQVKSEENEPRKFKLTPNNDQDSCSPLNSFVKKLVSLLVSEYGDSVNDIYSCIQVTSLQRLMMHNFSAVLKMRIRLVERTIIKYVVKQLGLDSLLSSLRNIYFFQDEIFSQSLCDQLFTLVQKCRTPREFANWTVLSKILQNAISVSHQENNPLLASVNANIVSLPEEMPAERTEFLHLFRIEFEVQWPLNIVVHQTCIQQYLKIFSSLLEIEFLCWLLGRAWRTLIMTSKELHLDDSPQFREIMLNRFNMEQFIRVIRNSIHQHLQGPLWDFLQKSLSVEESSLDSLQSIHLQYLEKASARCFLTDETHVLHELVSVMFRQIYKFCSAVFECRWEKNDETGHYKTFVSNRLSSSFDTFKQYQKVFLKRIMKEALTKKFGRHWDKEYQEFLEIIHGTDRNIT